MSFKVCPLCETLNVRENEECFVCAWHGSFENQPDRVHDAVMDILQHCPVILDCLSGEPERPKATKPTLWQKLRLLFRRRIDLRA